MARGDDEWLVRKAAAIRRALIDGGVVVSPEPDREFTELPPNRRQKWINIARAYFKEIG